MHFALISDDIFLIRRENRGECPTKVKILIFHSPNVKYFGRYRGGYDALDKICDEISSEIPVRPRNSLFYPFSPQSSVDTQVSGEGQSPPEPRVRTWISRDF